MNRIRLAVALASALCAGISHADTIVPPQGYVWYAPLFVSPAPNADAFGNLPGPPEVYPTPQEAGTGYCQLTNPTWTAQVSCGPGQQFPCGYACFDQNGGFVGGTALGEAAVCPFGSFPESAVIDGDTNTVCRIPGLVAAKNTGCPDCPKMPTGSTDPINLGIGNSYQVQLDYVGTGPFPLRFERHYNSNGAAVQNSIDFSSTGQEISGWMSPRWKHSYDRSVVVHPKTPSLAKLARQDGRSVFFRRSGGVFLPEADGADRLERLTDASGNPTGWKLTVAQDDSVELYDAKGKLLSIANRAGLRQTLAYGADGRLASVSDPFGLTLIFGYNAGGRLTTVTDPSGGVYTYAYDTAKRLVSVAYPDTRVRQYLYENAAFRDGLTAIVDENGARYASWTYDAQGRAISSEHAGGVNRVSAVDPAHVIDVFNNTRAFAVQNVAGVASNTSITGPVCPSCGPASQTFDANRNLSSRTDWNGNRTSYTYDLARNIETSRTEALTAAGGTTPQTRTISTEWHATFRLPTRIAEPLRITTNVYDADGAACGARGALCSKTVQATSDANGALGFSATTTGAPRTWSYTYNANGSVLIVNGPRTDAADVTSYAYYANDDVDPGRRGRVATVTNAAGHVTSFTAYNGHGQPLAIVDPNGLATTLAYDARQRLVSRNVGGELTSYDYDFAGQLTRVTLPDGSFLSYAYDAAHRLTGVQDSLGNRIAYTLDLAGNRTQEQVLDPANALLQTRSRVYSSLNRLFQELGAAGQTTEYGYDDQGNVTSVKDPLLHTTGNQYDALNRLKQVTDPALGITLYGYNGLDALTQVTDPRSLATSYALDGLGNLNQQASPDTGATTNTYDAAGNLLTQTDAKGQVTTYAYDTLNRVALITFHDGSKHAYAYDLGTNGLGRLSSVTETNPAAEVTSVISYAYDQHGRVTSETRTVGGLAYVLAYAYDAAGRLSGMTYPSGRSVAYSFDALGRVSSVTTTKGVVTQVVVQGVQYHPFGGVKGFTFGNGQTYTRGIDQDGRIASYNLGPTQYAIGYDAAGRISFISDVANPANANTYGYDALDRLISAVLPFTPFAYSYDAVGNRLSKTVGSATETYTYGTTSNRIAALTPASGPTRTFDFDANGSTIDDGLNTYFYDARGRMVRATSMVGATAYQVNALGQRIRKTNASTDTVFHYDTRGRLIAETDPGGSVKRELIYLGDIPVGVVQ